VTNSNANVRRQAIDLDLAGRLLPNGTEGQNVCRFGWRKKGAGSDVTCYVSHYTAEYLLHSFEFWPRASGSLPVLHLSQT